MQFVPNDESFTAKHDDRFRIKMDYGEDVFQLEVVYSRLVPDSKYLFIYLFIKGKSFYSNFYTISKEHSKTSQSHFDLIFGAKVGCLLRF